MDQNNNHGINHKATLEFNLDTAEGVSEFNNAVAGGKIRALLRDHDMELRSKLRHHSHEYTSEQLDVIEKIRSELHAAANTYGIDLSEDSMYAEEMRKPTKSDTTKKLTAREVIALLVVSAASGVFGAMLVAAAFLRG